MGSLAFFILFLWIVLWIVLFFAFYDMFFILRYGRLGGKVSENMNMNRIV